MKQNAHLRIALKRRRLNPRTAPNLADLLFGGISNGAEIITGQRRRIVECGYLETEAWAALWIERMD